MRFNDDELLTLKWAVRQAMRSDPAGQHTARYGELLNKLQRLLERPRWLRWLP